MTRHTPATCVETLVVKESLKRIKGNQRQFTETLKISDVVIRKMPFIVRNFIENLTVPY